ncbi:hypothetical protein [Shewanella sp. NIFS-20-20]|uniref:hypothetical protein n=1 Tax=Shewanella sp. NIFS-20-20 TaxID=2853806 RepID=UPI0035274187
MIIDLDGTLTQANSTDYANVLPRLDVIAKLQQYHAEGFTIVIATAGNMRRCDGNVRKINIMLYRPLSLG